MPELPGADEAGLDFVRDFFAGMEGDWLSKAACFDASHYIPDDLQVKIDRASMRVSLEVRCPLLDPDVAAIGCGLSTAAKLAKTPLRRILKRRLPEALVDRPKRGFTVPLAAWMAGPLKEKVEEALFDRAVVECGWLAQRTVRTTWERFLGGADSLAAPLWSLFSLARQIGRASW